MAKEEKRTRRRERTVCQTSGNEHTKGNSVIGEMIDGYWSYVFKDIYKREREGGRDRDRYIERKKKERYNKREY